jgi:hypothetical protein
LIAENLIREIAKSTFRILGLLEAIDTATQHMKDSKDILLMDLDNNGLWKIMPKELGETRTKIKQAR